MEVLRLKRARSSRCYCEHCGQEVSHTQYAEHKKAHFINGVWETKPKRTRLDGAEDRELTEGSRAPSVLGGLQSRGGDRGDCGGIYPPIDSSDTETEEMPRLPFDPDNGVGKTEETDEEIDPQLQFPEKWVVKIERTEDMQNNSSENETPVHEHGLPGDGPHSACPATDNKNLLAFMMSGLSRQMTEFAAEMKQQLTAVNTKLLSIEERITALEDKVNGGPSEEEIQKKRRMGTPRIAETVRRLHNSEANSKRYKPDQGVDSPHNEAVTAYLFATLTASPNLYGVDHAVILSACKTYYETKRRNFRYSKPDLAAQAAAMKYSARSRQRRKKLLEDRQSVLTPDEMNFWKGITIDMMSDEEDGTYEGVSGWIVRPPSFRSQQLSNLCATLQARLEASPSYTNHRRLCIGPPSERMPLNTYDSEAAKRHFKPHLMPQVL